VPELVFLESPYRFVLTPLLDYIGKVERECPDRQIAVLVPELVVKHWCRLHSTISAHAC